MPTLDSLPPELRLKILRELAQSSYAAFTCFVDASLNYALTYHNNRRVLLPILLKTFLGPFLPLAAALKELEALPYVDDEDGGVEAAFQRTVVILKTMEERTELGAWRDVILTLDDLLAAAKVHRTVLENLIHVLYMHRYWREHLNTPMAPLENLHQAVVSVCSVIERGITRKPYTYTLDGPGINDILEEYLWISYVSHQQALERNNRLLPNGKQAIDKFQHIDFSRRSSSFIMAARRNLYSHFNLSVPGVELDHNGYTEESWGYTRVWTVAAYVYEVSQVEGLMNAIGVNPDPHESGLSTYLADWMGEVSLQERRRFYGLSLEERKAWVEEKVKESGLVKGLGWNAEQGRHPCKEENYRCGCKEYEWKYC